ncbi:hypothetical protein HDC90_001841 [Pedobacter sp. AK013]|nr:hypothetical protein [Pedobacter sp. AK013]
MHSGDLGGQYYFEKQGSVLLGHESPAISSSPHSTFFAADFPFYQVYFTGSCISYCRFSPLTGFEQLCHSERSEESFA